MGRKRATVTKVTAKSKKLDLTVTGRSGEARYNQKAIGSNASFWQDVFRHVEQKERWNQWSCAETNAAARLLARGCHWKHIRFQNAEDFFGGKPACQNCSQWIDGDRIIVPDQAVGSYSAAAKEAIEEQAQPQEAPDFRSTDDFPTLFQAARRRK